MGTQAAELTMRTLIPVLPKSRARQNRRSLVHRLAFRLRMAALTSLMVLTAACGEEGLAPQAVAGAYVATTFTVQDTQLRDVLVAGGSLQLNLVASGATTGQLFVPASITGGPDLSASMAGTFACRVASCSLIRPLTRSSATWISRWLGIPSADAKPSAGH